MSAKQVGEETGNSEVQSIFRAEQFNAHDGAGERRVGRAREDGDKT